MPRPEDIIAGLQNRNRRVANSGNKGWPADIDPVWQKAIDASPLTKMVGRDEIICRVRRRRARKTK